MMVVGNSNGSARLADPFGWRASLRFKGRMLLSMAAIALGVALGYAIHLINAAAVDEFARGLSAASGSADLVIRGPSSGFSADAYPLAARMPAVAVASPVVEIVVAVAGTPPRSFQVLGIDALRAGQLAPALVGETAELLDILRDDTIFLNVTLAGALGKQVGDALHVRLGTTTRSLRVAGFLGAQAPLGEIGVMDIAGAQALSEFPDRLSHIDLRLHAGVSIDMATEQLRPCCPLGCRSHASRMRSRRMPACRGRIA